MAIRMTGLTSGLDTESIVNALMSAQRTKQTKVENKKQKLEWKQEVWKSLNISMLNKLDHGINPNTSNTNKSTEAITSGHDLTFV